MAIFSSLAIPSLFILIMDGSGHIQPVVLMAAYKLLLMPEFYYADSGLEDFRLLVFGIPIAHQTICVTIAWVITKTMPNKTRLNNPLPAPSQNDTRDYNP